MNYVKTIKLKVMSTHCKFKRLKILMVTIKKHSTTNMTLGDPMLTDNPKHNFNFKTMFVKTNTNLSNPYEPGKLD